MTDYRTGAEAMTAQHYVSKFDPNDPNSPISEEDAELSNLLQKFFRLRHSAECTCQDCIQYQSVKQRVVDAEMAERKRRGMSPVLGASE
jgi:hypothetical protein